MIQELVPYIDANFRPLPHRDSRGIAGDFMGGYDAIRFGMKYPEVFSAIYALSPCCLMNNPQPRPTNAPPPLPPTDSAYSAVSGHRRRTTRGPVVLQLVLLVRSRGLAGLVKTK